MEMPSQLPFFPWEVRYSPAGLQPVLCTGAWWAGHIRILAQGTSTQGLWEANLETWRTGEGPRWRDTGLEVSLQAEACGRQKRENEDTCFFCAHVCPGTALAAAAACAIGTAWETSAGDFTLHTRASQRRTGRSTARRSSCVSHTLLRHSPEMLSDPTMSKTVLQSAYQPSLLQRVQGVAGL